MEEGLVQSILAGKAGGSVLVYITARPISAVLISMSILSAMWPVIANWRRKRRHTVATPAGKGEKSDA